MWDVKVRECPLTPDSKTASHLGWGGVGERSQPSAVHSILCPFYIFRAAEQFGAASGTEERWLRFSTQQVAAAKGPGPNRRPSPPDSGASPQTPGGSLRPAAPHNISRCKWPNRKTRRENSSQSGAADSGVPPPFARPQ